MERLFFILYSVILLGLYLVASFFLFLFSFKTKYKDAIPARFFLWKNSALSAEGIWFHSCSFGEAKAIKPLVDRLPQACLRMSTTTQTGFDAITAYTQESRYLPFEPLLFGWIKPQKALVVMEAEFWYLLFALAQKRGAKTLLINARMSDRSFPGYYKARWFYKQIFRHIDEVYAQTALDKERLESLGAKNVAVTGNIKLAQLPTVSRVWVKPEGLLVCAASTHETEEALILNAFAALKKQECDARLIVVPRHPERFDKVAKLVEDFAMREGLSQQRFSHNEKIQSDIVVLDTLGELVNLYAISDIVILGGAFAEIGGHNAAEAAQFGCKIISGVHYFNQRDIFAAIEEIAIVEDLDLTQKLLDHSTLKETKITYQSDIKPIIESLKDVL